MPDHLSGEQRSRLMGRVRHKGTQPELNLRKALWGQGLRYRLNVVPKLPGSPDIIFPGKKVAIFIDGCFWHGCPLHGSKPKTNTQFWEAKIMRNQRRDIEVDAKLVALGWKVIRLWEHEVKDNLTQIIERIKGALTIVCK